MLHILNGDATAEILKEAGLRGELLPWREALICGPAPGGLSREDWIGTRAEHLSDAYLQNGREVKKALTQQIEALASLGRHDEIVLWFEFDLFCQVNLLYLLNWFSTTELSSTHLSLICIDAFPGMDNFRGLGQLRPRDLVSLFDQREGVFLDQLDLAQKAWAAYSSPDPTMIESLLQSDTSRLPYLEGALRAHLARFPSVENGLGRIENRSLELISGGIDDFVPLFGTFGELEPDYGLGDSQFWNHLQDLRNVKEPVLRMSGVKSGNHHNSCEAFAKATFRMTAQGATIFRGEDDFIEVNGLDKWLGGVHLCADKPLWRWDSRSQKLVG